MTNWSKLAKSFQKLAEWTGTGKETSYMIQIEFDINMGVWVTLGCYHIADWPERLLMGPFEDEEKAFYAACNKVHEAFTIVNGEMADRISYLKELLG